MVKCALSREREKSSYVLLSPEIFFAKCIIAIWEKLHWTNHYRPSKPTIEKLWIILKLKPEWEVLAAVCPQNWEAKQPKSSALCTIGNVKTVKDLKDPNALGPLRMVRLRAFAHTVNRTRFIERPTVWLDSHLESLLQASSPVEISLQKIPYRKRWTAIWRRQSNMSSDLFDPDFNQIHFVNCPGRT